MIKEWAWWSRLMEEYEQDGYRDFDAGIFDPPYHGLHSPGEDPEEDAANRSYKAGYDRRRKEVQDAGRNHS